MFQGVEGPHDFAAKLHRQGRDVRISEIKTGDGSALTVNVPELGLSLISSMQAFAPRRRLFPNFAGRGNTGHRRRRLNQLRKRAPARPGTLASRLGYSYLK